MIQTIGPSKFYFRPPSISYYRPFTLRAVSLYASRDRAQQVTTSIAQQFPPIPNNETDINRLGLNRRPTFFGCDPKQNPAEFPLLIYIPNAPPADGSDPVTK